MEPTNILHIKTLDSDWIDNDLIMLHACFQLLSDCIENERLLNGVVDWTIDNEHVEAKKEIQILYDWWKVRIENESENKIDPILTKNQYHEDSEMLIRLIKIRKYLWT